MPRGCYRLFGRQRLDVHYERAPYPCYHTFKDIVRMISYAFLLLYYRTIFFVKTSAFFFRYQRLLSSTTTNTHLQVVFVRKLSKLMSKVIQYQTAAPPSVNFERASMFNSKLFASTAFNSLCCDIVAPTALCPLHHERGALVY